MTIEEIIAMIIVQIVAMIIVLIIAINIAQIISMVIVQIIAKEKGKNGYFCLAWDGRLVVLVSRYGSGLEQWKVVCG